MDEFNNDLASFGLASDVQDVKKFELKEISIEVDSEVLINNKDDLFWVENEVILQDNENEPAKCARNERNEDDLKEVDTSDSNTESNNTESNLHSSNNNNEKISSAVTYIYTNVKQVVNDVETLLWKYFTQENSSQLRCNLCLGLFLYQSNARHLLNHIEVAHDTPIEISTTLTTQPQTEDSTTPRENTNSISPSTTPGDNNSSTASPSTVDGNRFKYKENSSLCKHFTKLVTGKFRCNLCFRILYNLLETTVVRHFKSYHSEFYTTVTGLPCPTTHEATGIHSDLENLDMVTALKKCFIKVVAVDKIRCKLCHSVLKFNELDNRNLQRHLARKHCDHLINTDSFEITHIDLHDSNDNCLDQSKKDKTMVVLEVIQDSDNNYVLNTELNAEYDAALSELTNSSVIIHLESGENDEDLKVERTWSVIENIGSSDSSTDKSNVGPTVKNNTKLEKRRTNRSTVWNYFTKLDSRELAKCCLCSEVVRHPKGTTSNMLKHLAKRHGIAPTNQLTAHKLYNFQSFDEEAQYESHFFEFQVDSDLTVTDITDFDISDINVNSSSVHTVADKIRHIKAHKKRKNNTISNLLKMHYSKLYRDKVICNFCEKTFSYRLGQISHLVKHLRFQHRVLCSKRKSLRSEDDTSAVNKVRTNNMVWNYFTALDDTKAQCDICEHVNILWYTKSFKLNLINHLRRNHNIFLNVFQRDKMIVIHNEHVIQQDDFSEPGINMNTVYQYFSTNPTLRDYIECVNEQIVCRICSGTFLCDDLMNFESTMKKHVQACQAAQKSKSLDTNVTLDWESASIGPKTSQSKYNALEAISSEINTYKN